MTDVMQRCVPISTGGLSPDLRVNYQFGLVLGVDEFEQEDLYFRERDERASRSLHGYGTAVGLHVSASRPAIAPDDLEVRVEPGVAVDQFGRPVVVRSAQCARVGAWLAAREIEAAAAQEPSPLQAHLRPSGDVDLYVVAEYSSCLDALVPLPGNPCGADDDVLAASRIRDSWNLGFRWVPPTMQHWDGVRALADVLLPIELHDGSLLESDEVILAAHVRALAPNAPAPAVGLPSPPVLPRSDARAALDRLLTIWLTEVRPTLVPDLVAPAGDAAILLSTLTLVPGAPFDNDNPTIVAFAAPDDEGRPYLAPTQLIQELAMMGGGVATIVATSPITVPAPSVPVPLIELASLGEVGQGAGRRLVLWPNLSSPLLLPASVNVSRNGGTPVGFTSSPGPIGGTFQLSPPGGGGLVDGQLLEVRLDLDQLRVRDVPAGADVPLIAWLERAGIDLLGREGTHLRLRHTVSISPVVQTPPPVSRPVRELLTALPVLVDNELPGIELWWHVDKSPDIDDERVVDLKPDAIAVLAEVETLSTPVSIPIDAIIPIQHNVFHLVLNQDVWKGRALRSPYLRVLVVLEGVALGGFGSNPIDYAEALGIDWKDAQDDGRRLFVPVRVPAGMLR